MNQITINSKWCKQCGICFSTCPTKVYDWKENTFPAPVRINDCTGCKLCELKCPDFAITVEQSGNMSR